MRPPNFGIKADYRANERVEHYDDTPNRDEWQDDVYRLAATMTEDWPTCRVVDVGCGSAFKLLKYFSHRETCGLDLARTVDWLKAEYPQRAWATEWPVSPCDLLIASDVIEHLPDPDVLLNYIADVRPRLVVLSTPDRTMLEPHSQNSPIGPHHAREWTQPELTRYLGARFRIKTQYLLNRRCATQVVVLEDPFLKG